VRKCLADGEEVIRTMVSEMLVGKLASRLMVLATGSMSFQNVALMGNFLPPGTEGDVGFYQSADIEQ
jgi:hypothetical protein